MCRGGKVVVKFEETVVFDMVSSHKTGVKFEETGVSSNFTLFLG